MTSVPAGAQDPPPPLPRLVVEARGTVPKFPSDLGLAASRGLPVSSLPGIGLGFGVGAHVYVYRWKAVTFGLGADVSAARAHSSPLRSSDGQVSGPAITERLTSFAPLLSFNFGTGNGWSYLNGGIGRSMWSVVPDGQPPTTADDEPLKTINYGGGARWFLNEHLAFQLDARFYAIDPSPPHGALPGGPRTTLLVFGGGITLKPFGN
jgi:hypothetical protein